MKIADAIKLRQSVERVLFAFIVGFIITVVAIKLWTYADDEVGLITTNSILEHYKNFTVEGDSLFKPYDYVEYIKAFIRNIVFGHRAMENPHKMATGERNLRSELFPLCCSISNYQTLLKLLEANDLTNVISIAVNRFMGRHLVNLHKDYMSWINSDLYNYLLYFKPSGFENINLQLEMEGKKMVMELKDHVILVMLQYISTLHNKYLR